MEKLTVAICDDESAARSIIAGAFQAVFRQSGVEMEEITCASASELMQRMKHAEYDLLLLDIDLPGMNGVAFGKWLREQNNSVSIIFVSSREDRVFDTFEIESVGFVRKNRLLEDVPFVVRRFLDQRRKAEGEKKLVVETREKILVIPLKQIVYIEGARNSQLVHRDGQSEPIQVRRSMQELEEQLYEEGFLRIQKGYLVNFRYIRLIEDGSILLTNGERLSMSRRKTQETKSRFLDLMQRSNAIL